MADQTGMSGNDVIEILSALKDEIVEAAQEVRQRLELDRRMEENPWVVLGLAAGVGFVLGGGLWSAVRPIAKGLGRAALAPPNLIAIATTLATMHKAREQRAAEEIPSTTSH